MSTNRTVVKVKIGNDEFSLRSDRSEEYTRSVAQHVDRALSDVMAAGTIVESHKAAILAALAIADELFQARRAQTETAKRLEQLSTELSRLLPPVKRGSRATDAFATARDGA
jgi:cell division protein ZapA